MHEFNLLYIFCSELMFGGILYIFWFYFSSGLGPEEAKASDKVTWLLIFCLSFRKKFGILYPKNITLCIICNVAALQIRLEGDALFCSGILMLPHNLSSHQMKMVLLLWGYVIVTANYLSFYFKGCMHWPYMSILIQLWDMRNIISPIKEFSGHTRGNGTC